MESYEEYLERTTKKDSKESWIQWKIDIYQYSKEKAKKRAESQYYPIFIEDQQQSLIGLNIKYLRKIHGMTQTDLMRALNSTDTSIIGRWERGIYMPTASQISMPLHIVLSLPLS